MKIAVAIAQDLLEHVRSGYPFEVCGVLLRERPAAGTAVREALRIVALVRLQNHETEQPRVRYRIDPLELARVDREASARGLEIAGYYHSHPDHPARPSETDRRVAAEGLSDGVLHVVVGVQGGVETTPSAWLFRDALEGFEPEPFEVD